MRSYIDLPGLCLLSREICARCNLTPVRYRRLMDMYFSPVPQPIVLRMGGARVWIDKYYAAYMLSDGLIRYVYVSRHHIAEEREGLSAVRAERKLLLRLPAEVEHCFAVAQKRMDAARVGYLCDRSAKWED